MPNDSVSSIKVGSNVQAKLCRDSGLSNTCQWFSGNNSDLSTTSIGTDQASSVQVIDLSQYVTVCTGAQLGGTCKSFGPGTVSDLSAYGLSSNIVSVHVSPSVTLYLNDGVNLSGQPGIFNNDVMDLTANNWNSRAKSLKIEQRHDTTCNTDPAQNGILLYRDINYSPGGGCVLLTADNNDLGQTLDFTTGSSLQFVGNYVNHYKATIYVDANYGASCGSYSLNQSDLEGCSDKTASIRIEPYTPPTPANNIAPYATRDQSGSDAAADDNLSTDWIAGHAKPIGFVFDEPRTIKDVVVFDRSQSSTDNNQINKIQLVFSDGTVVNDIDMTSGGPRCAEVAFPEKTVSWVNVVPTDSSGNNGYKDVQIWDTAGTVASQNNCVKKYQVTPAPGAGPTPLMQQVAPQIVAPSYAVQQGQTNAAYIQATDPGNTITLSASNLPALATFTDFGDGLGSVDLAPGTSPGTYPVTVQASNGVLTTSTTLTITVTATANATTPTASLTDNWSSGTVNSTLWSNWSPSQVSVNSGALQMVTTPTAGYYGLDTSAGGAVQNFSNSSVTNQLVDAGNQSLQSLEVYPLRIAQVTSPSNQLQFYVSNNTVYARVQTGNGYTVINSGAYSAAQEQYFRLREASGTVYWETSGDGQQWNQFATVSDPFDLGNVVAAQMVGAWQDEGASTTVRFDNFNVIPSGAPAVPAASTLSDDWSSGTIQSKWSNWSNGQGSVDHGQLRIASALAGNYVGLDSNTATSPYSLLGSSVRSLLVDAGNQSLASWEVFPVTVKKDSDVSTALQFDVTGGNVLARVTSANTYTTLRSAPYDPRADRYFRIAEQNGTTYWDMSADGVHWVNFTSASNPFDLSAVRIGTMVGTWQAEGSTTAAVFDDFNAARTQPSAASLLADWNTSAIDTSSWNNWNTNQVAATNQQLQLSTTANSGYYGVSSTGRYDLTNASVENQVVDAGNQSLASFQAYPLVIGTDSNNQLSWCITGNTIQAQQKIGGTQTTLQTASYNASQQKYFRIRESAGTVYWEYSADNHAWTVLTSLNSWPFDLTNVDVEQMVGTWQAENIAATAIFDNLNVL